MMKSISIDNMYYVSYAKWKSSWTKYLHITKLLNTTTDIYELEQTCFLFSTSQIECYKFQSQLKIYENPIKNALYNRMHVKKPISNNVKYIKITNKHSFY